MKHESTKHRRRREEAEPFRQALKEAVGRCEICRRIRMPDALAIHEVANGYGPRAKALNAPYAVLVVCREPSWLNQTDCHREVQNMPKARQLAILYLADSGRYDLGKYLSTFHPNAPDAITQAEVDAEIKSLLSAGIGAARCE